MEKLIKIGEKEVLLNNNVAWTMEYRDQFGKDIVLVVMPVLTSMIEGISTVVADAGEDLNTRTLAESLQGRALEIALPMFQAEFVDLVVNVTWAMAKAANEGIMPPKQWVKQFDTFPLDEVGPEIFDLVVKGFVSSKNLERLKKVGGKLINLQPSHSTTSSSEDSNED